MDVPSAAVSSVCAWTERLRRLSRSKAKSTRRARRNCFVIERMLKRGEARLWKWGMRIITVDRYQGLAACNAYNGPKPIAKEDMRGGFGGCGRGLQCETFRLRFPLTLPRMGGSISQRHL